MNIVLRHRSPRSIKYRRFIHIIPNAIYSISHKVFIKSGPPSARLRTGKVRKCASTRPYFPVKLITIDITNKSILLFSGFIHKIVIIHFYAWIYHIHGMESIIMQILIHALRIGKIPVIDCEYTEFIHIVDIKPYYIARYLLFTKSIGNFFHSSFRHVRKTRLMITDCPSGRHTYSTGQFSKSF